MPRAGGPRSGGGGGGGGAGASAFADLIDVNFAGVADGDVPTWDAGTSKLIPAPVAQPWANGDYIVKTFRAGTFAYNDADILIGKALYTPTVGDWILDAWFKLTTQFDGSTPALSLKTANDPVWSGDTTYFSAQSVDTGTDLGQNLSGDTASALALSASAASRFVPAEVLTTSPLLVILDDSAAGDPGSTQGAGELWLTIATPVSGSVIQGPAGPGPFTMAETPPGTPSVGQGWFDTANGGGFLWNGSEWVQI